jgi:hypothetical protein
VTQAQDVTLELPAGLVAGNGTARVTTVRIPAGSDRADVWLVGMATGSWRVRATHPDFVPLLSDPITVAMPPNFLRAGSVK